MGYQTYYQLEVEPAEKLEELLDEPLGEGDEEWKLGDPLEESCKWYEHEKEMVEFSKRFPEAVFHLHGEGEESGDLWYKDFKNGQVQVRRAEIVYPEYDETWGGVVK